jgi:protein-tyrosine kinase
MNSTTPAVAVTGQSARGERAASHQSHDSIGAILIRNGRLSVADADKVMRASIERNLRFGDAAVEMGLLTAADIELALSRQYDYPYLLAGHRPIRHW